MDRDSYYRTMFYRIINNVRSCCAVQILSIISILVANHTDYCYSPFHMYKLGEYYHYFWLYIQYYVAAQDP